MMHTCGIRNNGTAQCWGDFVFGDAVTAPSGTFTQVSAGGYHSCAIQPNGTAQCWGTDDENQSSPPYNFSAY